jgi:hypothetical protein
VREFAMPARARRSNESVPHNRMCLQQMVVGSPITSVQLQQNGAKGFGRAAGGHQEFVEQLFVRPQVPVDIRAGSRPAAAQIIRKCRMGAVFGRLFRPPERNRNYTRHVRRQLVLLRQVRMHRHREQRKRDIRQLVSQRMAPRADPTPVIRVRPFGREQHGQTSTVTVHRAAREPAAISTRAD